jgi:oxaloacetate decarboxylase gamma subunit
MSSESLFEQGLSLMIYGMGTVIIFLSILVLLTALMSTILTRWFPEAKDKPVQSAQADIDPRIIAVIQAAIDKHRSRD